MVMLNFQEPLNIVTGTSVLLQRLKELGTQNLEKHTHTKCFGRTKEYFPDYLAIVRKDQNHSEYVCNYKYCSFNSNGYYNLLL